MLHLIPLSATAFYFDVVTDCNSFCNVSRKTLPEIVSSAELIYQMFIEDVIHYDRLKWGKIDFLLHASSDVRPLSTALNKNQLS